MRLKIEPNRLLDMLNVGLIGGKLDDVVAEFTPKAVMFRDKSMGVLIVHAVYTRDFFPSDGYQVEAEEKVVCTKYMVESLQQRYKKDEMIEFYTEGNKVYIKGKDDLFEAPLHEPTKEPFTKMKLTDIGFVPTAEMAEPAVLFKIDPKEIVLKSAEKYVIDCSGKDVSLKIEYADMSKHTAKLHPSQFLKTGNLTVIFDGDFLATIAKLFKGDIWCGLNENLGIFSQREKTHAVTFVLATREM